MASINEVFNSVNSSTLQILQRWLKGILRWLLLDMVGFQVHLCGSFRMVSHKTNSFITLQLIIFKCVKETERENRSSHSWQNRIATSLKAVGNGSNHRGNAQTHDGEDEGNLWTTLYISTILLGDTKIVLDIVNIVVCLTSPDFEQSEEGIHEQVRKLQIWWRLNGAYPRRPPRRHTRGWYIVACLGHHICQT